MKNKFLNLMMILTLTASVLTGCGSKETPVSEQPAKTETEISSEVATVQDNVSVIESTEEIVTDTNADINLLGAKIEPIEEEDAVVNIDGVEVKMMQTWEEFQQFMADNGWTMEEPEDFPYDDKLSGSGYVNTHCGKIEFRFMKNAEGTGSELRAIAIAPVYLTNKNVNIGGITIYTTHEEISKVLQLETELPTGASYYLDDYLTVSICETIDNESCVTISRTVYNKR